MYTKVQHATATPASGTTGTVSLTGVKAGNLVVVFATTQESGTAPTINSVVDNATPQHTFTLGTSVLTANSQLRARFAYDLAASGGTRTYTVTWSAAAGSMVLIAVEFSPAADVYHVPGFDTQNIAALASTALASGTITTTDAAGLVVGMGVVGDYGGGITVSAQQINGVAADAHVDVTAVGSFTEAASVWWRVMSATFSNGQATATGSGSTANICGVIAFTAVFVVPISPKGALAGYPKAHVQAQQQIAEVLV